MIYVPDYNTNNCAYIYNSDIIRVYDTVPRANSTIQYKDYYLHNDYMYNTGSTTFNQYSSLPVCIDSSRITTDIYYRVDLAYILIIFFIMCFVCFYVPWKIFVRLFRRYQ